MASITIRNLPEVTKEKLRIAAAKSGLSLESYARRILGEASRVDGVRSGNLADLAQELFGSGAGVNLELPERGSRRQTVKFD